MATSIGNRTAAITSVNAVIAAVSALTSVNKAAITSINAGPASTFDALSVKTSITIGGTGSGNGIKALNVESLDSYSILEVGGATGGYVDLKNPFSDDFDIRLGTTGAGGHIKIGATGQTFEIAGTSETLATFTDDGSVALYHNNVKKLETAADGVDVDDINLNGKVLTITGDTDDTFKITAGTDGATTLATVDTAAAAAHLILDADGVIVLDGGDAQGSVFFKNNNTTYATMYNSGNNLYLKSEVSDGDLILQGNDGGVAVAALTLDMSAAGLATFNDGATFNGDVTLTGDAYNVVWDKSENSLEFADNARAKFGTGGDLEIWHDGSNSNIKSGGAGSLIISSNFSETGIVVVPNGKVALYYDNAEKLQTTATGATVTGAIVADSATVDDISLDGKVITIIGDTDDTFKITAGTHGATTLATVDTAGNNGLLTLDADGRIHLDAADEGVVILYNNGTRYGSFDNGSGGDFDINNLISDGDILFKGSDGGSGVTALTLDMSEAGKAAFNAGATFANNVELPDNVKLTLGATADVHNLLELYHDGTNSILRANTAPLWLQTDDTVKITKDNATEAMAYFIGDGAVELYHDASKKFETTATGATITGVATATSFAGSGAGLTAGTTPVTTLDIDGATDIGEAITDSDLLIIDNGAGGTNRKTAASRLKTYISAGSTVPLDDITTGDAASTLATSAGNITIDAQGTDTDIIFKGTDGGVDTTFLTLDGSNAGAATFNNRVTAAALTVDDIDLNFKTITITGDTGDTFTITSGAAGATTLATTDAASNDGHITLAPDGYIVNNAGKNGTYFQIGGTSYGLAGTNGSTTQFILRSLVSDGDFIIQGNDGGATIDALTFDMSAAGKAIFNAGATFADNVTVDAAALALTGAGNKAFSVESTDAIASMELGGTTGAFIDLKRPFSDDYDIRFGSGGAGGFLQVASGQALTIMDNVGSALATFADGDSVDLYHNHSKKFETTAAGATVTGGLTADSATIDDISLDGKVLTITGDTSDTFTITSGANGATTLATVDTAGNAANLTVDADGSIRLDSGSTYGTVQIAHDGTVYGDIHKSGNDLKIRNSISDGDFIIQGVDGGSFFNALVFDMSEAGKAHFNAGATFANDVTVEDISLSGKVLTITGDTGDTFKITTGANGYTTLATVDTAAANGHLVLDVDGQINLDAGDASGATLFKSSGTHYSTLYNSGANLYLKSEVSDGDMVFQGNDGGSGVNALILDMSEAGWATFNSGASLGSTLYAPNVVLTGTITANQAVVDDINLDGKVLTITGDTDDTFTITSGANGATTLATTDAAGTNGNIILDADGAIVLDAGSTGGPTLFQSSGTRYGTIDGTSNNFTIRSDVSDADIIFRGDDGGSGIAALTLDMSDAGKAIFNVGARFNNDVTLTTGKVGIELTNSAAPIASLNIANDSADGTVDYSQGIVFSDSTTGGTPWTHAAIVATGSTGYNGNLIFATDGDDGLDTDLSGLSERMRIDEDGNVGIGTTTPLKKLHVDGPALSTVKTLTDASTVTSDFDTGQNFTLTLAGNRTLGAPSNVDAGQVGSIFIIQDGTGSRTLAYNSIWKFAGGTAPVLSTAAGAIDRLDYIVQSGTAIQALLTKAYA